MPAPFALARLVRPGGRAANVGVHGVGQRSTWRSAWIKDVTTTTWARRHEHDSEVHAVDRRGEKKTFGT